MDLQNRDTAYHRRLTTISAIVFVALGTTVLVGQRYAHRDNLKLVGWKGEMELLPEISIEPDVPRPEAVPASGTRQSSRIIAVPVAEHSSYETNPPATSTQPGTDETDVLDLQARGTSRVVSPPSAPPGSYSNTYVILHTVKPKYPEHERNQGIEGSVTVELLIDTMGLVAHANVLELDGPESFRNSALEAVRQFEFQPPVENGVPTTMWIKFVIKFRMNS